MFIFLAGCKGELYTGLSEVEANKMLALLVYNDIPAEKQFSKDGVSIMVGKDDFMDAVEILRLNGLPERKRIGIQDIFPSGQLVSSPEQEQAKFVFLKSQQIENMISHMDGVISVDVSIADNRKPGDDIDNIENKNISASVFIKYSPDVNVLTREPEIRALVLNGISGITPGKISIALQQAQYLFEKNDEKKNAMV